MKKWDEKSENILWNIKCVLYETNDPRASEWLKRYKEYFVLPENIEIAAVPKTMEKLEGQTDLWFGMWQVSETCSWKCLPGLLCLSAWGLADEILNDWIWNKFLLLVYSVF
jgi:hypothetical protein